MMVKEIKSKSGLVYRLEFKKRLLTVTCLSTKGSDIEQKKDILRAMGPLDFEWESMTWDSITYKCSLFDRVKAVRRIRKC